MNGSETVRVQDGAQLLKGPALGPANLSLRRPKVHRVLSDLQLASPRSIDQALPDRGAAEGVGNLRHRDDVQSFLSLVGLVCANLKQIGRVEPPRVFRRLF